MAARLSALVSISLLLLTGGAALVQTARAYLQDSHVLHGGFDAALSTHLPGHEQISSRYIQGVKAFGANRINDIYTAEGRLLAPPQSPDAQKLKDIADYLNALYQKTELPTCVIAVPPPIEIYGDTLLPGGSYESILPDIQAFYDQLQSPIRTIDARRLLENAQGDYICCRTDSRWTGYGAYLTYQYTIRRLGFAPVNFDQYSVTHAGRFTGSLYSRCPDPAVQPDNLDCYICSAGGAVTSMDACFADGRIESRSLFDPANDPAHFCLGQPCTLLRIRTNRENGRRLLVVGDSSADAFVPFLVQHYSEISVVGLENLQLLDALTDPADYSQLIVLKQF